MRAGEAVAGRQPILLVEVPAPAPSDMVNFPAWLSANWMLRIPWRDFSVRLHPDLAARLPRQERPPLLSINLVFEFLRGARGLDSLESPSLFPFALALLLQLQCALARELRHRSRFNNTHSVIACFAFSVSTNDRAFPAFVFKNPSRSSLATYCITGCLTGESNVPLYLARAWRYFVLRLLPLDEAEHGFFLLGEHRLASFDARSLALFRRPFFRLFSDGSGRRYHPSVPKPRVAMKLHQSRRSEPWSFQPVRRLDLPFSVVAFH